MATLHRTLIALVSLCFAACGGGDPEPSCPASMLGALSKVCAVTVSVDRPSVLEIHAEATISGEIPGTYSRTSLLTVNGDGYGFLESEGATPGQTRIVITQSVQVAPGQSTVGISSYPHIGDSGSAVSGIAISVVVH